MLSFFIIRNDQLLKQLQKQTIHQYLKVGYSPRYVNKAFVYILVFKILNFIHDNYLYFYIMLLQYNKWSRYNNQALQEHKME
jgi:hypothetical protein